MLTLQNITYLHPNKEKLFEALSLHVQKHQKIALIGNNGSGKSTLLKIIAGILPLKDGFRKTEQPPYYLPQNAGQFNNFSIANALNIETKLKAFQEIMDGIVSEKNLQLLDEDWSVEDRCYEALSYWNLSGIDLNQKMDTLSGGQKTKVFLAGMSIHNPEFILMDEPSNHLDMECRRLLYRFIKSSKATIIMVSHDRKLLDIPDQIFELGKNGINIYGGNYAFYLTQKNIEGIALNEDLREKEKALRKAREIERETAERKQKLDARGKKKQEKSGLPTISMNTLRNNSEKSASKIKEVHADKTNSLLRELNDLRKFLPEADKMKLDLNNAQLHRGKILIATKELNFAYSRDFLWSKPLNLEIVSGDRISIQGKNGSGKTTFIKIILNELKPSTGSIFKTDLNVVYIDQDYSFLDDNLQVFEQAQIFNNSGLEEHEVKIRLVRFLFTKQFWDKPCHTLSGGEKMRLVLCCLLIGLQAPDVLILDEPTNNLDLQNIKILTSAIKEYNGTLIVISHDETFLEQVKIVRSIVLS